MEIKKKAAASEPLRTRRAFMRYGAIAAALLLVIGGTAGLLLRGGAGSGNGNDAPMMFSAEVAETRAAEDGDTNGMLVLNDYDELYALLMETRNPHMRDLASGADTSGAVPEPMETGAPVPAEPAMDNGGEKLLSAKPVGEMNGAGGEDYTETNVQVKGVDEADIIKTDGQYIYYLTGEELIIARADGENTRILSRTAYAAADAFSAAYYGAQEMFLQDGCVAILASGSASVLTKDRQFYQDQTSVLLYDVSNPARPKLKKTLGQSGYYLSSRMVDGVQSRLVDQWDTTVIHQAWRPVIVYINGQYWGHYNLRERAGVDMVFVSSNAGLQRESAAAALAAAGAGAMDARQLEASVRRILSAKERWIRAAEPENAGRAGDFAAAARMAREAIAAVRGKACRAGEKTFFCGCADYRMTQAANADPEAKPFPEYMGARFGAKFAVCSRDPEEAEIAELVKRAEGAENIIFSSCNAHLFRGQLALAAALAGKGVPMTVAALRNPYDLSLMPENTALLAAFDYTRDSLAALADVFSGGDCRGAMPVAL